MDRCLLPSRRFKIFALLPYRSRVPGKDALKFIKNLGKRPGQLSLEPLSIAFSKQDVALELQREPTIMLAGQHVTNCNENNVNMVNRIIL